MKTIPQILRHRAGVKEIKATVALPPLTNEYPYSAATPKHEMMAANNLTKEQLKLALELDELRRPEVSDVESTQELRDNPMPQMPHEQDPGGMNTNHNSSHSNTETMQ